jgi:hypothetical protein
VIWHDETCSSRSSDSIATRRKTAFENYWKNLNTIQWSEKTLRALLSRYSSVGRSNLRFTG